MRSFCLNKLKNKGLICLCIVITLFLLFPCFLAVYTNITMLGDASNWFLNALSEFSENRFYVENIFDHRARMFVLFIDFIPLNIAYHLFKIESLNTLSKIYALTLAIIPIILSLYSTRLFYRANKSFLGIVPLLMISLGIIPVLPYGCCEAYTAIFLFLIFFQYFYLDIEFKKYDYFMFIMISLALFDIHEMIVPFYPIIIWAYIRCKTKTKTKMFGFICYSLAVLTYIIFAFTPFGPDILADNAVSSTTYCFIPIFFVNGEINNHIFFYIFTVINLLIALFSKDRKYPLISSIIFLIVMLTISFNCWIIYDIYRFTCIYLTIIFCIILLAQKNTLKLKIFCINLIPFLITSFIISNLFLYNISTLYKDFSKQIIKTSEKSVFYAIEEKKLSDFRFFYPVHCEQMAYSIIAINSVKNSNKTKGIITSQIDSPHNYLYVCGETLYHSTSTLHIKLKTKFWDLTEFRQYFREICE